MKEALIAGAKDAFLHYPFWAILGIFLVFMLIVMGISLLVEWGQGRIREKIFLWAIYIGVGLVAFLVMVYVDATGKFLW